LENFLRIDGRISGRLLNTEKVHIFPKFVVIDWKVPETDEN
jgi:hypothetical protein